MLFIKRHDVNELKDPNSRSLENNIKMLNYIYFSILDIKKNFKNFSDCLKKLLNATSQNKLELNRVYTGQPAFSTTKIIISMLCTKNYKSLLCVIPSALLLTLTLL